MLSEQLAQEFQRITNRVKALEDGSELARAQVELESRFAEVVQHVENLGRQVENIPEQWRKSLEDLTKALKK